MTVNSPSTPAYVPLHNHSEYSIIDSILRIKPWLKAAKAQGLSALALTDRNNLYAAIKFYKAARAEGIKPIIGCDLSVRDEHGIHQLVLLAKNHNGFKNLCRLVSHIYAHDQKQGVLALDGKRLTPSACEDLIALSGGHEGDVAALIQQEKIEEAQARAQHWQQVFAGHYYFQVTQLGWPQEALLAQHYHRWGQSLGIASVATNLACFLNEDDFKLHEIRSCISSGDLVDDPKRPRRYRETYYFKSPSTMAAQFPSALLANSLAIAQQCNLELPLGTSFLPAFPTAEGLSEAESLRQQSEEGLTKRLHGLFPEALQREQQEALYRERLHTELQVIENMGFPGYFLIVADFIRWAKEHNIPVGPGRGSGAGSLVAYSLGITDLNPMAYDLLFERFLNPERVSMPDFDVDFCMDRRDEVIQYVSQRYGAHRVAQIATHGTMAAKAVLRDVARATGMPYALADRLSKMIPKAPNITLDDALGRSKLVLEEEDAEKLISPEFIQEYQNNPEARELIDLALSLEGMTRNVGKHAGGVVIAPTKLSDFSALYSDEAGGTLATQFDKDDIEAAGLVKFDFLGLRNLTIIDWALAHINRQRARQGEEALDLQHLPLDDAATYALLQKAQTTAVFQLESSGIKRLTEKLKPDCFEDIIALVALFRPGPLKSGMVDDFVACKHGEKEVVYPHPLLEPILKNTYGVMVYQEQVMQVAQVLAGYTLGGADELRRAMGKKKVSEMARHRDIFIAGAVQNGVEHELAGSIFDVMAKFAEYGFNKSHSAAYALVSYQTAWLKTHYPAAFMAAVLTADMEHSDKIVRNIEECRQLHVSILPPCINQSQHAFTVDEANHIRFGLGAIKGVGLAAMSALIEERERHGAFQSLADLCRRVDLKKIGRKTLEPLVCGGALDALDCRRGVVFAAIPDLLALSEQHHRHQQQAQLFDLLENKEEMQEALPLKPEHDWTVGERLEHEKRVLGLYLSQHPIDAEALFVNKVRDDSLAGILQQQALWQPKQQHHLTVVALIVDSYSKISKKGKNMAFLTLDDGTAQLEVIQFLEEGEEALQSGIALFRLQVKFLHFRDAWQYSVQEALPLTAAKCRFAKRLRLHIKHSEVGDYPLQLAPLLPPAPDEAGVPVRLVITADDLGLQARLRLNHRVLLNQTRLQALEALLGEHRVELDY